MKATHRTRRPAGFVSLLLVLSTATILSLLMIYAYKRASQAQEVESQVQLRIDYSEKEEAILRSIIATVPNRAISAMRQGSNATLAMSNPLRWNNIFTEALVAANARTSMSSELKTKLNITTSTLGNTGDAALGDITKIFAAVGGEAGLVSIGQNRSLGAGFPPPLSCTDSTTSTRDATFPIISSFKQYGSLSQSGVGLPVTTYPDFNLVKYPQINFGYSKPGEDFVAKRNWWAFSVDVGGGDAALTKLARRKREFVLSIYEIPSQLAISASAFMSLGQYASGAAWQNVTIDGGVFAGKAVVEGSTTLTTVAARRSMTLSDSSTVGGEKFTTSPFTAGVREDYQVTQGKFFPVSLASESGRAAFVPINRGADYFDRFSCPDETNTVSTTTWNDYSVGARQCDMRLDVTATVSSTNITPTMLRFSYRAPGGARLSMNVPQDSTFLNSLPPGYIKVCEENQSYTFSSVVDVAYGASGGYTFRQGLTGPIAFNNSTFGDPKVGSTKAGFWRPRAPFDVVSTPTGQKCIGVYPERFATFFTSISAGNPTVNKSLVVNVDYTTSGLNNSARKPAIPCTDADYGVILKECANLSPFSKGFSLVTNLRLYIGDDFNTSTTTPPSGYTPPSGSFFPPCSLFAPEKRYGVEVDPFAVTLSGQIGSLASGEKVNVGDADPANVRPLDSTTGSGTALSANRITVNLRPIKHPAELPPISMMNWLVLLEERRREFY